MKGVPAGALLSIAFSTINGAAALHSWTVGLAAGAGGAVALSLGD